MPFITCITCTCNVHILPLTQIRTLYLDKLNESVYAVAEDWRPEAESSRDGIILYDVCGNSEQMILALSKEKREVGMWGKLVKCQPASTDIPSWPSQQLPSNSSA